MNTPPAISNTAAPVQTAYGKLDKFEKRFVRHYVSTLNGARAAVEAGYKGTAPSRKAYKLLQRPDVKAAIEEYERFYMAEIGARATQIMKETLAIGTSDIRRLIWCPWEEIPEGKKAGDRKELHELDGATASAIAAIDIEEISTGGQTGRRYKYKFWDKNKALEKLGQYTKLWDAKGNVVNVDARTVDNSQHVHVGGTQGVSGAIRLLERISAIGSGVGAAPSDPNGSVLPAAVRPGAPGHGASMDAGQDPRGAK